MFTVIDLNVYRQQILPNIQNQCSSGGNRWYATLSFPSNCMQIVLSKHEPV